MLPLVLLLFCVFFSVPALADYVPLRAGNIGIGTFSAYGGKLIVTGGNVGIGSLAPGQVLDVSGSVRATTFSGNGDNISNLAVSVPSGFTDGGSDVFVTTTSDNLGIGTTSSVSKLSVIGNAVIGSSAGYANLSAPTGGMIVEGNVGIGSFSAPAAFLDISSTADQDLFRVNDDGTGDSTPFIVKADGNVGIGTINPEYPFIVRSTTEAAVFDPVNMWWGYLTNGETYPRVAVSRSLGSIAIPALGFVQSSADTFDTEGSAMGMPQTRVLAFYTSNGTNLIERMRVDLGGNLGIGTVSPVALWDITSTSNIDLFRLNDNGTGDTSPFIIKADGNVGIGTSMPPAVLVVAPPATETIAAGGTITADACGTLKRIQSGGSVTTSTSDTFTSATSVYDGCCMDVLNVDTADTITLDNNSEFASNGGANVALGPNDGVRVCSDGAMWYQIGATSNN